MSEVHPDAIVEVIRPLDDEVLVVLVEGHGEPVQEAVRAEDPLERHLQSRVRHEGHPSCPLDAVLGRKGELNIGELNSPVTTKDADLCVLGPCLPKTHTYGIASASVEERDRCACVDEGSESPVTRITVLQPDIESRAENGWIALLPVGEEVVDPAQPTPITMSSVR